MLHPQAVQLPHVLTTEILEQVSAHQLVAQCHENAFFDFLAADRQAIGAGATRTSAEAREAVAPVHDVPAAALGALRETGEEILWAPCLVEPLRTAVPCCAAHLGLPRLHLLPQIVVDDAQVGHRCRHPRRGWIGPRNAFACVGLLDVAQPVPHESADIQLVVQDSRAPRWIAVNRARIPGLAIWP
jgi:hypothetical protein